MVIAEGHLAIIIGTTRADPDTTLVIERLRPAQNNIKQDTFKMLFFKTFRYLSIILGLKLTSKICIYFFFIHFALIILSFY